MQSVFKRLMSDVKKAEAYALNRSVTSAVSSTTKLVRQSYNIKSSSLKKNIKIFRAKSNKAETTSTVVSSGKRIPLAEFSARQTRLGVSAEIKKGRRKVYRNRSKNIGSFMAIMPSGHRGVFIRKGSGRLPLVELKGPSAGELFSSDYAFDHFEDVATERFSQVFLREVERRTSK